MTKRLQDKKNSVSVQRDKNERKPDCKLEKPDDFRKAEQKTQRNRNRFKFLRVLFLFTATLLVFSPAFARAGIVSPNFLCAAFKRQNRCRAI